MPEYIESDNLRNAQNIIWWLQDYLKIEQMDNVFVMKCFQFLSSRWDEIALANPITSLKIITTGITIIQSNKQIMIEWIHRASHISIKRSTNINSFEEYNALASAQIQNNKANKYYETMMNSLVSLKSRCMHKAIEIYASNDKNVAESLMLVFNKTSQPKLPEYTKKITDILSWTELESFHVLLGNVKNMEYSPQSSSLPSKNEYRAFEEWRKISKDNNYLNTEFTKVSERYKWALEILPEIINIYKNILYKRHEYKVYMNQQYIDSKGTDKYEQYKKTWELIESVDKDIQPLIDTIDLKSVHLMITLINQWFKILDEDGEGLFARKETEKEEKLEKELLGFIDSLKKKWYISKFEKLYNASKELDNGIDKLQKKMGAELKKINNDIEWRSTGRRGSIKSKTKKLDSHEADSKEHVSLTKEISELTNKIDRWWKRRLELEWENWDAWLIKAVAQIHQQTKAFLESIDKEYHTYFDLLSSKQKLWKNLVQGLNLKNAKRLVYILLFAAAGYWANHIYKDRTWEWFLDAAGISLEKTSTNIDVSAFAYFLENPELLKDRLGIDEIILNTSGKAILPQNLDLKKLQHNIPLSVWYIVEKLWKSGSDIIIYKLTQTEWNNELYIYNTDSWRNLFVVKKWKKVSVYWEKKDFTSYYHEITWK